MRKLRPASGLALALTRKTARESPAVRIETVNNAKPLHIVKIRSRTTNLGQRRIGRWEPSSRLFET